MRGAVILCKPLEEVYLPPSMAQHGNRFDRYSFRTSCLRDPRQTKFHAQRWDGLGDAPSGQPHTSDCRLPSPLEQQNNSPNSLTRFSKIGHQKTNVFPRQSSVGYFLGPERDHLWTAAQKPEPRNLLARTREHQRRHHAFRAAIEPRNMRQAPLDHGIKEDHKSNPAVDLRFLALRR